MWEGLVGFIISFFLGVVPMLLFAWIVYWLDRYEKEPLLLLGGVFLWGAVVSAGGAFIVNTLLGMGVYLFTQSEAATNLTTGSVIAPFVGGAVGFFGLAATEPFPLARATIRSCTPSGISTGSPKTMVRI